MEDNLKLFRQNEFQTKGDILFSLRALYKEYLCDDSVSHQIKALLFDFIRQIESLEIPKCADWWFYSYNFTRFGIELDMCHCEEIVFESKYIYTMTVDETLTISEIQCNMITVSEFAELHGVQSVTVRQWIRRGKLRAIKKQGRDWLIASIAEKPSRKYKPVIYEWDNIDRAMYKTFPFLKGINTLQISQNADDKSVYDILLGGRIGLKLKSSECEKLELALLALDDIKVEEDIIVNPIKVCLDKETSSQKEGIKDIKEAGNLVYGPVMITAGKHKGRIGIYDDEDEDASGETLAIVYLGNMLSTIRYEFIPFEYLSDQITTPALMNRVNEIYIELWKNSYDLAFQNDRLNELYLCSNLLENRYIRAREHMKTGNQIFISHSSKDLHIARALATDFINDGFSVFLDDWSIDLGENIISRISDEIEESHSLVMLISEDYLSSAYCKDEWTSFYMRYSKTNKNSIYPILINDAEPPALLFAIKYARIKEMENYQEVYIQLIKAIKKHSEELSKGAVEK